MTMRVLAANDLLELWELGFRLCPLDQGLLALCAALPEVRPDAIAEWSLGRRNRALLELHAACFGSRLQAWAECASCGERMEFEVDAHSLLSGFGAADEQKTTVEENGYTFRLPTSRDLAQGAQESDPVRGAMRVLQACCIGKVPDHWTEEETDAIGERLATADPLAELRLALPCPACGATQEETLDPVSFVWSELQALAKRLLRDIHALASAYGWSEPEILSLSDFRRSQYVQMVRA
jgi:hypothetical protein